MASFFNFCLQETGILYGFRKPNEPWFYYFASLFQPHNELLNMWTHLVGMILVITRGMSMQNAEGWLVATSQIILILLHLYDSMRSISQIPRKLKPLYICLSGISLATDPFYWPLLSGLTATFIMYFLSTVAHTFQSRSEIAHYVFFMCDYAGKSRMTWVTLMELMIC